MRKFNPGQLHPPQQNFYPEIELKWFHSAYHHLEIGAGVGMHPLQISSQNPDTLMIAVERTREKFNKFNSQKIPENLFAINADIVPWLWFAPQNFLFDKIWILYPNPEPQNKNQRWVNMPFFQVIIERLKPQGEIIMATNIQSYYEEAVLELKNTWNLNIIEAQEYKDSPRTHFEKKYLERGEVCYNICARRSFNSIL